MASRVARRSSADASPWDGGGDRLPGCAGSGHANGCGGGHRPGRTLGILIKNATALEQASRIQAIIFDKTSTLTEGKPAVSDILIASAGGGAGAELNELRLLHLAATAETDSEHPLARTIVEEAARPGLDTLPYRDFAAVAGGGIQAVVEGHTVLIGTPRLLADRNILLSGNQLVSLPWPTRSVQPRGKRSTHCVRWAFRLRC